MTAVSLAEASAGWNAVADTYDDLRSGVGVEILRDWVATLPTGASVLDVGAGTGRPVTETLVDAGCRVAATDPSPAMLEHLDRRLPTVETRREALPDGDLFGRRFDGVVAIGVLFLLPPADQPTALGRLAAAVGDGGALLFTAPAEAATWTDRLTGRTSVSLGTGIYQRHLAADGLVPVETLVDEGGNVHHHLRRP